MKFAQYELIFRQKASQAGYSEENVQKCLSYAKPLLDKGFPVIYNTANLAALVGYDKSYLKKAALYTQYYYRNFEVKKKNGKKRKIREPLPSLKEIQLWILNNLLYSLPVSRYAKAYVKKRGIIDNVKYHIGKEKVLNLDIKDFFPSITRTRIEKVYLDMGYSSNVSNLLSKLCCLDEYLPQGAPTSPYLSNIVMIGVDSAIASYCKEKHIRFTRYADDLTFSGNFSDGELTEFVREEIAKIGLSLNRNKTTVLEQNVRQIVTGIVVNEKLQIPKKDRKSIRLEMYYLKKYGLASHLERTNNKKANYIKHVAGKVNYALYVNPGDIELKEYQVFLKQFLSEE